MVWSKYTCTTQVCSGTRGNSCKLAEKEFENYFDLHVVIINKIKNSGSDSWGNWWKTWWNGISSP